MRRILLNLFTPMGKPEDGSAKEPRVNTVATYRDPMATPNLVPSGFCDIGIDRFSHGAYSLSFY